jgi:uncharacterized protein (TIGR02452 family)
MDLKALALDTQRILASGAYAAELSQAIAGTRLYTSAPEVPFGTCALRVEVTAESTLAACRRLADRNVAALNFASARNPGGGWLGGARAQEESIARASALVACLESQPQYYAVNRAERSCLYTDHLIYSPGVPVFRDDRGDRLAEAYRAAFITSPAPNRGALKTQEEIDAIAPTLRRRGMQVLKVAAAHGHRTLVLGAWGCGAFRGDPEQTAQVFRELMDDAWTESAFELIVFAIIGGPGVRNFDAFHEAIE